tara:strand:- start:273 stop:1406 length:1134 start_codon:yes stop_codon:yes gene_type:complete
LTKAAELAKMGEVITNGQVGGRRNMLINGSMQISERGTSLAMAHDGLTGQHVIDRWRISLGGTHEQLDGTYAQVADHPFGGNGKSLKWTTGTAESSYDADEYAYVVQIIEAQNCQHLKYSTSDAETITVSFHVKSSITGTYALGLYKPDSSNRIFNQTYTIDSANTWEKKTLTFVGDTDSGAAIVNDNGQGLWVSWHLATGSNYSGGGSTSGWVNYSNDKWADGQTANVMTTASATWQLADCQVEVGSTATPFEHRSFGDELTLCQRYYRLIDDGDNTSAFVNAAVYTASKAYGVIPLSPPMRTTPSLEQVTGSDYMQILSNGAGHTFDSYVLSSGNSTNKFVRFNNNENFSTVTASHSGWFKTANTNAFIALVAEL